MSDIIHLFIAHSKEKNHQLFKIGFIATLCEVILIFSIIHAITCYHAPTVFSLESYAIYFSSYILFIILSQSLKQHTIELTENIVSQIRAQIIDKVRKVELQELETVGINEIYNAITIDTQNIADLVDILWYIINCLILIIIGMIYLGYISGLSFVYILITIGLGGLFYMINLKRISKKVLFARDQEQYLFQSINDLIYGIQELKINEKKNDAFYGSSYLSNMKRIKDLRVQVGYAISDGILIPFGIWYLAIFIIIFLFPYAGLLSKKTLIQAFQVILYIPITFILEQLPYVFLAGISVKRITLLENRLSRLIQTSDKMQPADQMEKQTFSSINFQGIAFLYQDNTKNLQFKLGPLDMSIHHNEIIFIVGGNGSGKSTLLKLITGLYFPHEGTTLIDNEKNTMDQHRNLFSAIFTDVHLFKRLYGIDQSKHTEVKKYLKMMQIDHVVTYENDRFNTLELSSGQKKRLAMVVALMEDKPIYIFDEWAAEQSPQFKSFFYDTLLPDLKLKGKTIISVNHDPHFEDAADRIYYLVDGKIVRVKEKGINSDKSGQAYD
jgi:putative ATP-binding cassette transporter